MNSIKSEFIAKHCPIYRQLHFNDVITSQISEVEKQLQVTTSESIFKNMTQETLQKAAEMFIFLASCSETVRSWFYFYEDLFTQQSPAQIIVTLNRVLKGQTTPENMDMKSIARKLFRKIDSVISLKYTEIKKITQGMDSPLNKRLTGTKYKENYSG